MDPITTPDLFSSLQAEHEPWLMRVFVQPAGCEQVASRQSTLVWGGPGAGKSCLRLWLAGQIQDSSLVAHWFPEPPRDEDLRGTPLFNFALEQALRTCIEDLVLHGSLHKRLNPKDTWTLTSLAWFLRKFLPFQPAFYIQSRGLALGAEQVEWYMRLLDLPPQDIMGQNATNADLLRLLLFTLRAAGYQSVTLLVDGLEKWNGHNDERTQQMLDAILSTLAVFDSAELVFKFFVPEALRPRFERSSGVLKARVNQLSLVWDAKRLSELLTRRIGLALGREIRPAEFCADDDFWGWLSKYSAESPRAWLLLARPFADRFLQNPAEPLSAVCWRELARKRPPLLRIGERKVWLAEFEIRDITASEFDLLAYLEKNPGKSCSVEELYYLGLQKLAQIPAKEKAAWSKKDDYRGAVDTALYRLRLKVETDPSQPIYLVTAHGKGVQLFPRGVHYA